MKKMDLIRSAAAIISVALPSSALAQTVATSASGVSQAGDEGDAGDGDIIVTAQRRSERLQDVPVAITALSASRLDAVGVTGTLDLSKVTPGLTYVQTSGFSQPHIRGVGASTNGPGLEQPVATYIDGVYVAFAPASLMSLNNVERIEILKGPQGTLFGRNATGGLVQVVTREPKYRPGSAFNLTYGSYETIVADAYVTGGLSDGLAADIALRYERQGEGYGTNLGTGNDTGKLNHDFAGRVKFLWEPSSTTRFRLAADYADRSSSREAQRLAGQYPGTFDNVVFGGPFPAGDVYDTNTNFDQIFTLKSGGVSLHFDQEIGSTHFQSISAYRKTVFNFPTDVDAVPAYIIQINPLRATGEQFSQELQLSSGNPGPLSWVTGAYFFHANDQYDPGVTSFGATPISPVPGVAVDIVGRDRQRTNSIAVYGQATYEILPATRLTLGGRYTYEHREIDGTLTIVIGGFPTPPVPIISPGSGIPTKASFNNFSYRIALDHKIGSDTLIYASYNTGFKSGGFNLGAGDNPPYKPETIKAFEGGLKTELFDRKVRVNISGFHYDYTNIQVGRYVGGNIFLYNGAKARNYGGDIDISVKAAKGLQFIAGFSYLHARFTSFPNADFITPIPNLPPNLGGITTGSAAGNRLPFSPTTTLNLGVDYSIDTSIGRFAFNANYYRTSKFYAAPDNVLFQKDYDLIDLSLQWTDPGEHASIKAFVRNAGDTVYRTTMLEATAGPIANYGAPRTYGVTLGYKF